MNSFLTDDELMEMITSCRNNFKYDQPYENAIPYNTIESIVEIIGSRIRITNYEGTSKKYKNIEYKKL